MIPGKPHIYFAHGDWHLKYNRCNLDDAHEAALFVLALRKRLTSANDL